MGKRLIDRLFKRQRVRYRPHRNSLDASLALTQEFNSVRAMKLHIVKDWNSTFHLRALRMRDIVIDGEIFTDERTGWDNTQHVCVEAICKVPFERNDPRSIIGMCSKI